jgi:adenylate kinase
MNIAIIGPSGAGKGTHATDLCTRFRLRHVATGDLFRDNLQTHTALGILARKYMEREELVPDEVVDAMIEEWCEHLPPERGALFDGFPRTLSQARFLDDLLQRSERELDAVIYLKVPDEQILSRLAGRLICRECQAPYHVMVKPPHRPARCDHCGGGLYHRPDDSTEKAGARLRVFHRTTGPVLDHYTAAGKLVIVSGEGPISDVDARLIRALDAVRNRSYRFATHGETAALPRISAAPVVPVHLARASFDLVLLGPPGCGKGTQAEKICGELHLPHIATGDLFRENLRLSTDLGRIAKTYMDRGELVPDDVTDAMVEERLARPDAGEGFVLDGFPRTLHQAHALMDMMQRQQRRLAGVLYIRVDDDLIVERLSGRLICQQCQAPCHSTFSPPKTPGQCDRCGGALYQRTDDSPGVVRARLATFHRQTEPLIEFYRTAGLLHEIDGSGELAEVSERSLTAVRQFSLDSEAHAGDSPSPARSPEGGTTAAAST